MRWPVIGLIGVCVALWIDALLGGGLAGGVAALCVVAVLAGLVGYRATLVVTVVCGVAAAMLLAVADQIGSPHRFAIADDGVFYAVVVLAPALAGWLIGSRHRQVRTLHARRAELEQGRARAVDAARAEELERVHRRVDVVLAQRLASVVTDVRAAHVLADRDPDRVPALLAGVEEQARAALAQLRQVLGVLHADGAAPEVDASSPSPAVVVSPPRAGLRRPGLVDALLVLATIPLAVETASPGHHGVAVVNVVLALAQGVALVATRRHLLGGLVLLLAIALAQTALFAALPPTVGWLLPGLLAAFLAGLVPSRRTALLGLAVLLAGVTGLTFATPVAHRATGGFVPSLVMGVLVWIAGCVAADRERRARELRAIADELDRMRDAEARLAAAQQRAELARDLHDVGAHALTVVCLQTGAAQTWWWRDRARARAALETVCELADATLTELGASFGGLADEPAAAPLDPAALDVLVGLSRVLGLHVDVAVSGDLLRVRADIARIAYRIVQEALTNAARHAGATTVQVSLASAADVLEVRVTDTGRRAVAGMPALAAAGSGLGLRGMRERVEAVRGQLRVGPSGDGFEVLARMPV